MTLSALEAVRYASEVYRRVEERKEKSFYKTSDNSGFNKISANYIRSTIGYPKQEFDTNNVVSSVLFKTEAGVEALVQVKNQKLIVAIAGTNSGKDWIFNTQYVFRVLRQEFLRLIGFDSVEDFRGYKLAYQTLGGYILHYVNTYEDLATEGIVKPITSAAVTGHSAGGMIANHLADAISRYFDTPSANTKGFKTQLFTFAAPVVYERKSTINSLEKKSTYSDRLFIQRFAIASDLVSQFLPFVLRRRQKFTKIFPAIALWKRPHHIRNFVNFLETEEQERSLTMS